MATNKKFTFNISLSVLNHLGRHLYRSFATVLGEAISNAWDADAKHVYLYIDEDGGGFEIADDGNGMSWDDFQNKFLKVGYSKRRDGETQTDKNRPFIGRKGIGKLALLSCADKVSVISKLEGSDWVGGIIDNSKLDEAITRDLTADKYPLGRIDLRKFKEYTHLKHGTVIRFDGLKEKSRSSFEILSKTIALYFRFSLLDDEFTIYLNNVEITHKHLNKLIEKTQFLWKFGQLDDPFIRAIETQGKSNKKYRERTVTLKGVNGFIASVEMPRDLKIRTTEERAGVDLFVNGRLRERDILKHVPLARVAESYLYGQIHIDSLDGPEERFTSSREGIIADDPMFKNFLSLFREELKKITDNWDKWRIENREDGDPENPRLTKKQRASNNLYNAITNDYKPTKSSKNFKQVDKWFQDLAKDAEYNFESYAECFISENLARKLIVTKKIKMTAKEAGLVKKYKKRESESKGKANISIPIRQTSNNLAYLAMHELAELADKPSNFQKETSLMRDSWEFKPIRDALMHTSLLTSQAKTKLTTVRENIRSRIKILLT